MSATKLTRVHAHAPRHARAARWAVASLPLAAVCVWARMTAPADREDRYMQNRASQRIEAIVEAVQTQFLLLTGRYVGSEGCGGSCAEARAGQITTMVTRFNQFLPAGAQPIPLVDGQIYYPSDLQALVKAGYCGDADLPDQRDARCGWTWDAASRRFHAERGQSPMVGIPE